MVKIWSMHLLPFINPPCSSLSFLSIARSIRPKRIRQRTLEGTESNVIPRQLSQNWMLLFLGSFTIRPLDQSSGMAFESQTERKKGVRTLVDVSKSAFSISALIVFCPTGFSVFEAFDSRSNFLFTWRTNVDVQKDFRLFDVSSHFRFRSVEDFPKMFFPTRYFFCLGADITIVFVL